MVTARERVRAELTEEIADAARRQLAEVGAAALSLRAVAREVGMVSSAVYRYFPSRDELLTALIVDSYRDLASAAERAVARAGEGPRDIWRAACAAIRTWARRHPQEYALLYGSPVPGYAAPTDTIEPALRVSMVLMGILSDGVGAGIIRPQPGDWLDRSVESELARVAQERCPGVAPTVLARGMIAWTELFGAVSFEVFGRLNSVIENRDAWFAHQVLAMSKLVGLRP